MTLETIFTKPVDRSIEEVIKADDEASLRLEIEEYVLTNEVEKRIEAFLDAYNNYDGANGVWVSGFFGSGKSHLLKMLALVMENRQIDGIAALDLFVNKCGENEILKEDLKRAAGIPSKSILFNIDQKADVISKTRIDALLAVFVKVFDEMCGYYGKQGHIAQFERDLDSRGLYDAFKAVYEKSVGRTWEKGREQALLESKNIAKAYAEITGSDASQALGVLDKYRSEFRVSIEDFADKVLAYIERQSPQFRLNFFVDEVGQYIAENVKLMTNLQTIAESLATKCRGRAWIVVTAQEDMGTVVGEMNKQQGNDFSKIQARFANRMKLTSADVAEVIQKRLLDKNDEGIRRLEKLYHAQENNFKTLFDFTDGSITYRNFRDRDHFILSYPFIPYQFSLFQSSIQNLSRHNAFEGKHRSVGERSMLGVFQQVVIRISDHEIGQLATFDLMFEGIRTALKSQIQRAIIQAERHLESSFAVQLLKTLFLVKYVKEFRPTVRNLCVLEMGSFNQDLPGLKKQVEEAFLLLEQQTYIQRNGELYEFLTDEEKDVEQEIKNTGVEATDVNDELEKIIFDHTIKAKKIRYEGNGRDFSFSRKLDDRLYGCEYELAIHVFSPFYEHIENEPIIRTQSMGRNELRVVMPSDERLMRDLLMYKRTEKYIRQNMSMSQQDTEKRILSEKGLRNTERYAELQKRVQSLLGQAKLILEGVDVDTESSDARTRITTGFNELVTRAFPGLQMLHNKNYAEDTIHDILDKAQSTPDGLDADTLSEAEQEQLSFIQSNGREGIRTTLKSLVEKFGHKPYGWYYAAILCVLAKLYRRGKVEVRTDGNLLEGNELERALRNSHGHGNVVLDPQVEFTASQVRALKELYEDLFDAQPAGNEAKALGRETGAALQELVHVLEPIVAQSNRYPFLAALVPVHEKLKSLTGKSYTWYINELVRQEDELLDMKEAVIDPLRKFMNGRQKGIYDDAMSFLREQESNLAYIKTENDGQWTAKELKGALDDTECHKGNRMQQVKERVEALRTLVAVQVAAEVDAAKETLSSLKTKLCRMGEYTDLNEVQQEKIVRPFDDVADAVENQKLIAVIRDTLNRFEETDYPRFLAQLTAWAQPAHRRKTDTASTPVETATGVRQEPVQVHEQPVKYIVGRTIKVPFDKAWLADETDVDRYLKAMRKVLLDEIQKGKRIQI
jgi:hypothetical protein